MNGAHDLGGMHGFGAVDPDPDGPLFHADWERRVLAINLALGAIGAWNLDQKRYAVENVPAGQYFAASYYQRWLYALDTLLVEKGLLTAAELASGKAAPGSEKHRPALLAADVKPALSRGASARMDDDIPVRFKVGDTVRARNIHPRGHTRLPRYARGKTGRIMRHHWVFLFPDIHAMESRREAQNCYAVSFAARELWGDDAGPGDAVIIDLWDPYLEPVA